MVRDPFTCRVSFGRCHGSRLVSLFNFYHFSHQTFALNALARSPQNGPKKVPRCANYFSSFRNLSISRLSLIPSPSSRFVYLLPPLTFEYPSAIFFPFSFAL